jgi:hypothetical protein
MLPANDASAWLWYHYRRQVIFFLHKKIPASGGNRDLKKN